MSDTYVDPYAQYVTGNAPPTPIVPTANIGGQINAVESGNNPNAKNPNSSALGPGQFTNSTWLDVLKRNRPDLAYGKSDADLLNLRTDPKLSQSMTNAYAAENSVALSKAGLDATPGNIYLAHFAGPGGATQILKADPNTPLRQILSPQAIQANPQIANMTAGQIQQWAAGKMQQPQGTPEGYYGGSLHLNVKPAAKNADPYAQYSQGGGTDNGAGFAAVSGALDTGSFGLIPALVGLQKAGEATEPGLVKAMAGVPQEAPGLDVMGAGLGHLLSGNQPTLSSLITGVQGDPVAKEAYERGRQSVANDQKLAQEQHPLGYLLGQVAGIATMPGFGAGTGATMGARIGSGALAGGVLGSAYGAGSAVGEGENAAGIATRAATGGVIGATGGAIAPPLMAGAGKIASAVSNRVGAALGHPIQAINASRNIDEAANARIAESLKYDAESGRGGMSAADIHAAGQTGQPPILADVGGAATQDLARASANQSPAGRAALEATTGERFKGQAQRVVDFIRQFAPFGGNATKTQEAIDAAQVAANKGAYARAYAAGNRPIISDELERLMGSPDVVRAMKAASEQGKSRAIADGFGAFNAGVKVTDDGRVIFQGGKNGVPTYPNIQFWDYAYRSLRDSASAAFRAGRNDEGSYLSSLSKQMRSALDDEVPEYGQARAGAAAFFGAENALEAGQKFLTSPLEGARSAIIKMSAPERALFSEGFVSALADKVSKISNNRSVTIDRIFNSQDGKARIAMALGPDRAQELEMFLRREDMMDLARKAISGNSTTTRQIIMQKLMAAGSHGAVGAGIGASIDELLNGELDWKHVLMGGLLAGGGVATSAVNTKLAQSIAEKLASDDPNVWREVLRVAAKNPQVANTIRNGERFLERIVGTASGRASPLLPSVAGASANQQQQ